MGDLWVREELAEAREEENELGEVDTRLILFSDSGVYETWTDNPGELFRAMQKEHGRCTSRVYLDVEGGTAAIGWVFEKIRYYEDTKEPYLCHAWVTVHDRRPLQVEFYRGVETTITRRMADHKAGRRNE